MLNYAKLYAGLFNAITDALRKMDEQEITAAKQILIEAQQNAEEQYICAEE